MTDDDAESSGDASDPASAPGESSIGRSANGGDGIAPETLGLPAGMLLAWSLIVPVNAVMVALATADAQLDGRTRLLVHLYDMGHALALGVTTFLLAQVWRWGAGRYGRWGILVLGVVGAAGAAVVLDDDLAGFVQRREAEGDALPWLAMVAAAVGTALMAAAIVGRLLDRPWLRLVAVILGLAAVAGNHLVLTFDYPGVHLVAALGASAAMGRALAGARVRRPPARRWHRRALVLALALAGAFSIAVRPNDVVWRTLFSASGSVVAPFAASLHGEEEFATVTSMAHGPWFQSRSGRPGVPPSRALPLPPDSLVIVLTVDALRADVADDDRHAELLPALAAMRRDALHFTMARSPTPSTDTTVVSMFTGKYYSQLLWTLRRVGKSKRAYCPGADMSPTVPGLLGGAAVATAHVVGVNGLAEGACGPKGFDQEIVAGHYAPAARVMDRVIERIEEHGDGRLFLYAHFIDPHAPYDRGGTQGSPFDRYLREVALVDAEIARLRAFLDRSGLASRTVLIVAADHGEAFGEHNTTHHARTLYEEALRVPLFVLIPGVAARRINTQVSLMDLGPTLLDMHGLPTPGHFMGESLVPFFHGRKPRLKRPIAADAGRRMQALYFPDGLKAIVDLKRRTRELYDLRADPGELRNLMGAAPDADERHALLAEFFRVHALAVPGYVPPWRRF